MKRIEPGMLCLVVSGHNAGRECTTIRMVMDGERVPEMGLYPLSDGWLVHGNCITGKFLDGRIESFNGYGCVHESRLMPISGGDKLEDLETEKDLGVIA